MTATVTGRAVPDPEVVLRREDERLARRAGDEPLPHHTITAFAAAVRKQIVEPLLARGGAAGAAAADREATQAELTRLRAELATVRGNLDRITATADRERAEHQAAHDRTRRELVDVQQQLSTVVHERDDLQAAAARLQAEAVELANELEHARRAGATVRPHRHLYPMGASGEAFGPCEEPGGGKPYPGTSSAVVRR
ncbi:hypothetical protein [Amycolatopsis methanolica]|uniref:Uncharacterized protein n=1 Tax=Amycolatopsis methanolica 239 TaxID=1068978 RepID=A0A076N0L6_AMYME|nr:hypothetical protein [Amycolatopsis methanolica]AIJ26388.1 hypothetical protein AMETH_6296 [Amycolatopsis methanolica 239]AIJ26447.1 hypothetical protein AMETH_6355 [Amycolatopsis methanolica 239]